MFLPENMVKMIQESVARVTAIDNEVQKQRFFI
jgi:hypothetical protein